MIRIVAALVGLSLALPLVGCSLGTYRVVRRANDGGEVALVGLPDDAREKANAYMASACAAGFDIVEEHEQVVGQDESSETRESKDRKGRDHSHTTTTTEDRREWRIRYQCKSEAAATAKAAPGATVAPPAPAPPAAAPATTGTPGRSGKIRELVVRF